MTLRPTPPTPNTTADWPRCTFARLNTAPIPVTTPHPMIAAVVSGTSSGILTHWTSRTTVRSANALVAAKLEIGSPSSVNGRLALAIEERHSVGRPSAHASHVPQLATVAMQTWSPGATCVTASPTSATMPAPSWPHTPGDGTGYRPCMYDRSLWHRPAAAISTITSRGPGARTSNPSTSSVLVPS
jgi:hypothetical protein